MKKTVYLIMSRQKDSFNIIYVGDCEQTSDGDFFTSNASFKCWSTQSNGSPYLAILPMFESGTDARKNVLDKIIARYHPVCNLEIKPESKPDYKIRPKQDLQKTSTLVSCPCCGSNMEVERVLENTTVIRCIQCGMSDTRLNS